MPYVDIINMETRDTSRFMDEISQRLSLDSLYSDKNNNNDLKISRAEKYSLRPRSMRRSRHRLQDEDEEEIIIPNQVIQSKSNNKFVKSSQMKQKQKAAPLSKYRRKTANARERSRMREINAAFEALRKAVPHLQQFTGTTSSATNEKLTKITTLRLAMKYISTLSSTLKESTILPQNNLDTSNSSSQISTSTGSDLGDLLSDCSDLDCLFLESDGESMHLQSDLSDHSLTPDMQDHCLTPVNLNMDLEQLDHSLSPTFNDQTLSPFDSLFPDFS